MQTKTNEDLTSHRGDSGMKKRRGTIRRKGIAPVQRQNAKTITRTFISLCCKRGDPTFAFDED